MNQTVVLAKGVPVRIEVDPARVAGDWVEYAVKNRKPAGTGVIIHVSNAHGVCYLVKHDDDDGTGKDGWYEAHELTAIMR